MDFVFDRIASGRTLKNLIVDDARHEVVAIVSENTIGGDHLTRILDGICSQRGKPSIIRSDNGPEFTGKSMLTWAYRHAISEALSCVIAVGLVTSRLSAKFGTICAHPASSKPHCAKQQ